MKIIKSCWFCEGNFFFCHNARKLFDEWINSIADSFASARLKFITFNFKDQKESQTTWNLWQFFSMSISLQFPCNALTAHHKRQQQRIGNNRLRYFFQQLGHSISLLQFPQHPCYRWKLHRNTLHQINDISLYNNKCVDDSFKYLEAVMRGLEKYFEILKFECKIFRARNECDVKNLLI